MCAPCLQQAHPQPYSWGLRVPAHAAAGAGARASRRAPWDCAHRVLGIPELLHAQCHTYAERVPEACLGPQGACTRGRWRWCQSRWARCWGPCPRTRPSGSASRARPPAPSPGAGAQRGIMFGGDVGSLPACMSKTCLSGSASAGEAAAPSPGTALQGGKHAVGVNVILVY